MTVVEEDYSIAEMTLESDVIVFQIDVKVQAKLIKIQNKSQKNFHAEEKKL